MRTYFWNIDWLPNLRGNFRLIASVLPWVGVPSFLYCGYEHSCMCGHLAHGPYSRLQWASDYLWIVSFAGAAALGVWSDMAERRWFAITLLGLLTHHLLLGAGFSVLLDAPLLGWLAWLVIKSARARREPDEKFTAVLEIPPVESAVTAVRVSIVAEGKKGKA